MNAEDNYYKILTKRISDDLIRGAFKLLPDVTNQNMKHLRHKVKCASDIARDTIDEVYKRYDWQPNNREEEDVSQEAYSNAVDRLMPAAAASIEHALRYLDET